MMAGTGSPSRLMDRTATVSYLWARFQVGAVDAERLLSDAEASDTGMAPLPREGKQTIWANHMVTQGGKFIIETEWPR